MCLSCYNVKYIYSLLYNATLAGNISQLFEVPILSDYISATRWALSVKCPNALFLSKYTAILSITPCSLE